MSYPSAGKLSVSISKRKADDIVAKARQDSNRKMSRRFLSLPLALFAIAYSQVINARRRYAPTIMLHENRARYRVPVVIIYDPVLGYRGLADPPSRPTLRVSGNPPVAECGPTDRGSTRLCR